MKVAITLTSNGSQLNSVAIDVKDELDDAISKAVSDLAVSSVLAVGDTITITDIESECQRYAS